MKEVIFHIFPFARFLGLSLKILFHKNKEIKRMLSKKMTFSLMSLITLLAFAFAVPSAMADIIGVTLSYDEAENVDGREVDVTIAFNHEVAITEVQAAPIGITVVYDDFTTVTGILTGTDESGSITPGLADATATTLDEQGLSQVYQKDMDPSTPGGQYDGKTFTFKILSGTNTAIPRADPVASPAVAGATRVYVNLPAPPVDPWTGIKALDPAHVELAGAKTLDIPLRTVAADQDRETPAVVSIQRLRPGSQTVVAAFQEAAVTGPFTVRVVLSEAPANADKFAAKINVANATKSGYVIGTPFAAARW